MLRGGGRRSELKVTMMLSVLNSVWRERVKYSRGSHHYVLCASISDSDQLRILITKIA